MTVLTHSNSVYELNGSRKWWLAGTGHPCHLNVVVRSNWNHLQRKKSIWSQKVFSKSASLKTMSRKTQRGWIIHEWKRNSCPLLKGQASWVCLKLTVSSILSSKCKCRKSVCRHGMTKEHLGKEASGGKWLTAHHMTTWRARASALNKDSVPTLPASWGTTGLLSVLQREVRKWFWLAHVLPITC